MKTTRRNLLKQSAIFSAIPLIDSVSVPSGTSNSLDSSGSDTDLFKSIALKGVDAATSLGAEYADVRITRVVYLAQSSVGVPRERQEIALGIRTLINGYWGFASSPYVDDEEVVSLATDAVSQSRINATGRVRSVEMSFAKPIQGDWSDPAVLDLLTVSYEELHDFARGWMQKAEQYRDVSEAGSSISLKRTEKVYASSEGGLISQIQSKAGAEFFLKTHGPPGLKKAGSLHLPLATAGWEYVLQAKPFEQIPKLIEEAKTNIGHMVEPVDVGRYTVVFDASCTGRLLAATLGPATQLDRAMGFEANAQGTSFLNKPLESLGSQSLTASLINITGDRTISKGAATARWDDEGVDCKSFPIVKDGTLVDYQTSREQASWLSPYYNKSNREVASNACVSGDSALDLPMQHMPNIVLHPGSEDASFEGLIGDVKDGIAISMAKFSSDFQFRHGGSIGGTVRKITNGKLAQYLTDAGVLFNTEELWKNVKYIGGKNSLEMYSFVSTKGEPRQSSDYSVFSVPMMVEDVSLINVKRKA